VVQQQVVDHGVGVVVGGGAFGGAAAVAQEDGGAVAVEGRRLVLLGAVQRFAVADREAGFV
jgi:hypothetical protein